jgi:branched-chain amino acid transport system substrate-binding protein
MKDRPARGLQICRAVQTTMKSALVGSAVALALHSALVSAQTTAPIKLGMVLAKTGFFAELGAAEANGAQIAAEQAGMKVLGRPIDIIWYDEPNPQGAQQNFEKLVQDDKVVAVVGGTGSATTLAMASSAKRLKTPFVVSGAAAREITGKDCNRYTFRTMATIPAFAEASVPAALERGKDWYFIVANYAYGKDLHATFSAALAKAGGKEVGADFVPAGTTDFSSYILKIKRAKPKVVVTGLGGSDAAVFFKQYAEYGMQDEAPLMVPAISDTHMWAVGPEVASGVHANLWHYSDPENSEVEKAFTKTYQAKNGKPPTVEAWQGWVTMRMLLAAMEAAKSTDAKAVVQSLEKLKLPNGKHSLYYRSWDHQFIHPMLLLKGGKPPANDKWDMLSILKRVPANPQDMEKVFGTQAEIGCTLGDY